MSTNPKILNMKNKFRNVRKRQTRFSGFDAVFLGAYLDERGPDMDSGSAPEPRI
jgi:hypothetical protein